MLLNVIILAAGQGKRMQSRLPKVLHSLAGKPLLEHIVITAQSLNPKDIYIVYGHGGAQVREHLQHLAINWVEQAQQLGTGHAVQQAIPKINDDTQVLVLVGDAPLITTGTLQKLIAQTPANCVGIVTVTTPNPSGLGRIIRDQKNNVMGIVEEKDASTTEKQIQEINSGIIIAPAKKLKMWLAALKNNNQQAEYYLTDIIGMAAAENISITTISAISCEEVQGINDRIQLAQLERYYQLQQAQKLMLQGVTLIDPQRFDVRGELICAADVTIDVNVIIEGKVTLGPDSYVGANTILRNVTAGKNVIIKPNSIIEDATIGNACTIGPFARIRPGTVLADGVHIGNFVEIKNSTIANQSKINHLSYVGDAAIGQSVNIGAGTITCNYDGANKHQTIIEDDVFVGSNTALVAPITVKKGSTIGAGSTISRDVPANSLALTRAETRSIPAWKRPIKKQKD